MTKIEKQKIKPILFGTYLAVIKNSVGSKSFRNAYALVNGKKTDILKSGDLSCAFYVSSVLVMFGLIKEIHTTVSSTAKDMEKSGWKKLNRPKMGSVLVWEEKIQKDAKLHRHIGFYVGGNKAISNSDKRKCPVIHSVDFGKKRRIETIFWCPKFDR